MCAIIQSSPHVHGPLSRCLLHRQEGPQLLTENAEAVIRLSLAYVMTSGPDVNADSVCSAPARGLFQRSTTPLRNSSPPPGCRTTAPPAQRSGPHAPRPTAPPP